MAARLSLKAVAMSWAVAVLALPETSRFLGKATAPGDGRNRTHIGEVSAERRVEGKSETSEAGEVGEVSADPETGAKMAAEPSNSSRSAQKFSSCHCCHHEEKISNPWASCRAAENDGCGSCDLYLAVGCRHCGWPRCGSNVIVGDKVCPVAPIGGVEGITSSNAAGFNDVWTCARAFRTHAHMVGLILNPWKARTQHQLHVKHIPLDRRGMRLKRRLEDITQCTAGAWHDAPFKCPYSKARLYGSMPLVFSEVMELASGGALGPLLANPEGQATLATVGIAVLWICDGKPVVLAHGDGHGGCSIEHSI